MKQIRSFKEFNKFCISIGMCDQEIQNLRTKDPRRLVPILKTKHDHELTVTERYDKCKEIGSRVTETKMRLLYGNTDGSLKWEAYKKRQAETNTFEYKKRKHGMTKETFDEYNSSRSQTLLKMIDRYGEIKGVEKWNKYCERQSYAGKTLQYFIDEYGDESGIEKYNTVCKEKALTLENFIRKYGDDGEAKYNEFVKKSKPFYSKRSQKLFWEIYNKLPERLKDHCYFAELNTEFGKRGNDRYYKYDFVISTIKYCIEYNGIHYHAKPTVYKTGDIITKKKGASVLADDIWQADKIKHQLLLADNWTLNIIWDDEQYCVDDIVNDILTMEKQCS